MYRLMLYIIHGLMVYYLLFNNLLFEFLCFFYLIALLFAVTLAHFCIFILCCMKLLHVLKLNKLNKLTSLFVVESLMVAGKDTLLLLIHSKVEQRRWWGGS
ncbi:hypothetical protein GLYMA_13G068302v4 [Glycine max]|nr:hypothetical protein GLYMA_13G068302v4 [Glycine max]KAH1100187.1 hypothetical protein GYH30_035375 [Glycine max]